MRSRHPDVTEDHPRTGRPALSSDYRVVLVTDAVSQVIEQGFRKIAGLGTVLCTSAEAVSWRA